MNKIILLLSCILAAVSGNADQSELISLLRPYNVEAVSNTMARVGRPYDGGYVIPKIVLKKSDVVMSYGIGDDDSFEISVINEFNKEVYAFDCGIRDVPEKNKKLYFFSECIGTDSTVESYQKSSMIISSYNDQIKRLKLENKKVFIKMDIEGAEYCAFYTMESKFLKNIQGMVIEIHDIYNNRETIKLLKFFNKNFVLVHLHGNNYSADKVYPCMEMTYVNKEYVKSKQLSKEKYPTSLDMPNNPAEKDIILNYWK